MGNSDGMNQYNPNKCGVSIDAWGIFICRLENVPCALHKGDKCYMQRSDEAVTIIANAIKRGETE